MFPLITDEEEEPSCATVLTLRPNEPQSEEDDADADEEVAMMSPELALLLNQSDLLHAGDSGKKTDGFILLRENKPLVTKSSSSLSESLVKGLITALTCVCV